MVDITAVIMAGGPGERFWPLSTPEAPKPFLNLFGDRSLIQLTRDRLRGLVPAERIIVLTSASLVDTVAAHLPDIPRENIIGEPYRRDTAATTALAALICRERFGDTVQAVLPADQLIGPDDAFHESLKSAAMLAAREPCLCTMGITPTTPATGYGYLELGESATSGDGIVHFPIRRFHEKPDTATAEEYLRDGGYLWNSGMFVWRTSTVLDIFKQGLPGLVPAIETVFAHGMPADLTSALEPVFGGLQAVSVDHGIMELAPDVRCIPTTFTWSDVGGWNAVADQIGADVDGNSIRGHAALKNTTNSVVVCENSDEPVAVIGVEGLIVVRARGGTLVADRDRVDDVKALIAEHPELIDAADNAPDVPSTGRNAVSGPEIEDQRPWGRYRVLSDMPDHKVKRIEVKPGKRLSLQRHRRRDEHWYVVDGAAIVTCGDTEVQLHAGEAVDIPREMAHRVMNPGDGPLVFIEVQTGEYFGEDDIERLEDDYGRS